MPPKTATDMVCAILQSNKGLFLSAREIREMIYDEYCYSMNTQTVRDLMPDVAGRITVKSQEERRGPKKQPMQVYCTPE